MDGKRCIIKALSAQGDIEMVNLISKASLVPEEVYCFELVLCDNEVDRDGEKFDFDALYKLAELFVGVSGIFDHNWSAHQQKARIYHTQVITDKNIKATDGEDYACLKARAYILRTAENEGLIAEIEGGIKKEVSIGCAARNTACSICGEQYSLCPHEKGRIYDGRLCFSVISEPTDAYEWSFVAVPAQKKAGVIKAFGKEERNMDLKKFLESSKDYEDYLKQLSAIEDQAALGREYRRTLADEFVRLGGLIECGVGPEVLRSVAKKLDDGELKSFKAAFERKAESLFPAASQLGTADKQLLGDDAGFLI